MKKIFILMAVIFLLSSNAFSTIITVSNNPNSPGEFTSLQYADSAASDGDTILVSGSPIDYADSTGAITIDKKLTIYGQGYDPRKDMPYPSTVSAFLLTPSAAGTIISGFITAIVTFGNAGEFGETGIENVNNIVISRCELLGGCSFSGDNWLFKDDIITNLYISLSSGMHFQNNLISNEGGGIGIYVDSSCSNMVFDHNYFGYFNIYNVYNIVFENNIFYDKTTTAFNSPYSENFYDCVFNNNIYFNSTNSNPLQTGINSNIGSGNINANPMFVDIDLTSYSVTRNDNFYLQAGSPGVNAGTDTTDIGPEGGSAPMQYPYSGEPDIPQIITMNMYSYVAPMDTLKITFTTKSIVPIVAAEYFIGKDPGVGNGTAIQIPKSDSLEDTFEYIADTVPSTYNIFLRTEDSAGNWSIAEGRGFTCVKYVFTGMSDNDWSNPMNWQNGPPPESIPGGMEVEIDQIGGRLCNDTVPIEIQLGGLLTVDPGKTLNLYKDLSNSGTMNGTGTIYFRDSASLMHSTTTLNSSGTISCPIVLINKQLFLSGNSNTESVTLNGGSRLTLGTYNLNIDTASLLGDSANFVVTSDTGSVIKKIGNTPVTFFVGTDSVTYTPITITNTDTLSHRPAGNPDSSGLTASLLSVQVRASPGIFLYTASLNIIPGSAIDTGNVNCTWFITMPGSTNPILTLTAQWDSTEQQKGFDPSLCALSNFITCAPPKNCNDGYYEKQVLGSATRLSNGAYTISRSGVTGSGVFIITSLPSIYTFLNKTADSSWNDPNNWDNGVMPPSATIYTGAHIIIGQGQCDYVGNLTVQNGGMLIINKGATLTVTTPLSQQPGTPTTPAITLQTGAILNINGNVILQKAP